MSRKIDLSLVPYGMYRVKRYGSVGTDPTLYISFKGSRKKETAEFAESTE